MSDGLCEEVCVCGVGGGQHWHWTKKETSGQLWEGLKANVYMGAVTNEETEARQYNSSSEFTEKKLSAIYLTSPSFSLLSFSPNF